MATTQDILSAAPHAIGRLFESAPLKLLLAIAVAIGGWLTTPGAYQAAVWMLLADWITGMSKGWLIDRHLKSAPMVRGGVKSLLYLGLLGCAFLMTHGGPITDMAGQAIALYVLTTEAISNLENLDAIATHYQIDLPALKAALQVLRVRQESQLETIIPQAPTAPQQKEASDA